MYKFGNNQLAFSDFDQPVGMKMSAENRWVKRAETIPWGEIEKRYAKLFMNRKGNVAKPLRLALGACIIQAEYGYSDEEVRLQIQESPYLQYFCGMAEYKDEPPFDASLMVYFRKRLTHEILGEINEMIIREAESSNEPPEPPEPPTLTDDIDPPNKGTTIVDASVAPSEIRYPTDTSLLNEARENSEKIIDLLHEAGQGEKPRTYRRRAHKEYVKFVRQRRPDRKKIRKCIRKQLGYLGRNLKTIDEMLKTGGELPPKKAERLKTLHKVYGQQKYMFDKKVHVVPDRIVSISRPYLRPIVRGKAKADVEFGAKLDISVVDGYTRLEKLSFDNYNEANYFTDVIERYKARTGYYPERALADKIYRNRENLRYCKERGIRLSGPALGRPKKDGSANKRQEYTDICDRVEVERSFSLAKRKCGMGLLRTRLAQTTKSAIALSIIVLNLRKIQHAFLHFWGIATSVFADKLNLRIWAFVQ